MEKLAVWEEAEREAALFSPLSRRATSTSPGLCQEPPSGQIQGGGKKLLTHNCPNMDGVEALLLAGWPSGFL